MAFLPLHRRLDNGNLHLMVINYSFLNHITEYFALSLIISHGIHSYLFGWAWISIQSADPTIRQLRRSKVMDVQMANGFNQWLQYHSRKPFKKKRVAGTLNFSVRP